MMKKLLVCKLIIIIFALCCQSYGQHFTTVSGTITDGSSQTWSNAIITANLIPAFQKPGPSLNSGFPITDSLQYVQANGSGTFSLTVDDNTFVTPSGSQWAFTVCSNTSAQCTVITLTISGTSQNISADINAAIPSPVVNAVPTILRAYNGVEATGGNGALYWRTADNTLWGCFALPNQYCSLGGGTWVQIGGGGGGGVSITATSPIVVTPNPITGTGVISCPTCQTSTDVDYYQLLGINGTSQTQRNRFNLIAGTNVTITNSDNSVTNSSDITISASGGGGSTYLPCQTGIGDGANAIPSNTYHQIFCKNDSGSTLTIHGISCATNNNGTSTLNASDNLGNPLLTGVITCTSSFATGTQSGTTTIAAGGWINFTFISDGISTQTTWAVY